MPAQARPGADLGDSCTLSASDLLRWFLVPPAAFTGIVFAFPSWMVIAAAIDTLCPPIRYCTAPWQHSTIDALMGFYAGIAAFLMVALPSWAAPSHRQSVSWVAYFAGAAFSLSIAREFPWLNRFAVPCAAAGGLLGIWIVRRYLRPKQLA